MAETLLSNDGLTRLAFSVYENKKIYALLLGSGLSRSAEIPTGWEITLDLIRRIAIAQGVKDQPDWARWYQQKTGNAPDYSVLLEELGSTPEERRSILHSYSEPSAQDRDENRKIPTAAHQAIAKLVRAGYIRVIITTNFDRLLETALREQGIEPTVIASLDALKGAEPYPHSECYILKIHGDYKDARILNTNEELTDYPDEYRRLLDRIFDEHGLIIAGWSGEWDHALRAAILRSPNRRYSTYWLARGALSANAAEIVSHRKAVSLKISSADDFFANLQGRVETLEATHKLNPMSTDLLVSSTKRYLSKPEFRIQLDELFVSEAKSLIQKLDDANLTGQGSFSPDEFQRRVASYESATEPLARMVGVLGRWGERDSLQRVLEIIQSLYSHASKEGAGFTVWLNLRSYPAVLLLTAYGLGLTRSEKWDLLFELFTADLAHQYRDEPRKAVGTIFLSSWDGSENSVWKHMPGLDRRKTPLSDHFLEVFGVWSDSFIGLTSDFESFYEKFEMLGSLAYLTETQAEDFKAPTQDFAWMPIGRSGWHSSGFEKATKEFQSSKLSASLLKSGFAHGSSDFLKEFIVNAGRMAARMRWM